MRKADVFPYYRKYVSEYEKAYSHIKTLFDVDSSVEELCKLRGYPLQGEQRDLLTELQICSCVLDNKLYLGEMAEDFGLVTKTERFLLDDRFIIPVRDANGSLITLIGYYPDNKKYITAPGLFFSKDVLFFNIDHALKLSFEKFDGLVFLVEGIFDCLSLRSIGLPALATMGSTVSREKRAILELFNKVIYIPDNDAVGRRALNRRDKSYGWAVPNSATGLRLSGVVDFNQNGESSEESILKIKDMDNFIAWFDADSVREILLSYKDSTREIEDLDMGIIKYCS